jgi:hypothetical protein
MPKYQVVEPVEHDRIRYEPGQIIELDLLPEELVVHGDRLSLIQEVNTKSIASLKGEKKGDAS